MNLISGQSMLSCNSKFSFSLLCYPKIYKYFSSEILHLAFVCCFSSWYTSVALWHTLPIFLNIDITWAISLLLKVSFANQNIINEKDFWRQFLSNLHSPTCRTFASMPYILSSTPSILCSINSFWIDVRNSWTND